MRHNPKHSGDDPEVVRRLIRENPWGILVSAPGDKLVASHYPVLLDEDSDELAVFTHVGRPDEEIHGFGDQEIMLIVQGRHGYISPSWYAPGATRAPTWNEILDEETNLRTLARLVEHFERHVENPMLLDPEWGAPVAKGTVGIRLPITRFQCKVKLSQDKDPQTQRQVLEHLRTPGAYYDPQLADDMERAAAAGAAEEPPRGVRQSLGRAGQGLRSAAARLTPRREADSGS
jgi:transcriptional regulator